MKLVGHGGTPVVPLCQRCHNCQGAEIKLKETSYIVGRAGSVLDLRGMESARFGQQRLQELSSMDASSLRYLLQLYGDACVGPSSAASTAMMIETLYDFEVAWGLA